MSRGTTDWLERGAIGASLLCLLHCAGLPLLAAALPALSHLLALPENLHLWILGFAAPSSTIALLIGRARHRANYPLALGAAGLALLAASALVLSGEAAETWVTIAGSLFLAAAHVANWRLRHRHHRHR